MKGKVSEHFCSVSLPYTTHIAARLVHVFMSFVYKMKWQIDLKSILTTSTWNVIKLWIGNEHVPLTSDLCCTTCFLTHTKWTIFFNFGRIFFYLKWCISSTLPLIKCTWPVVGVDAHPVFTFLHPVMNILSGVAQHDCRIVWLIISSNIVK